MSDIEEDIKILESMLEEYYSCSVPGMNMHIDIFFSLEQAEAIEHILEEREQDKKRIKELEEERQLVGMPVKNKRDGSIGVVLHQWNSGSIAVLENINPRVINTHDSWSTLEIITDEVKQIQTKDDSIPKQKVKDKIDRHKIAKEGFEKEYDNKHYEDDEIRARDFYEIVTQDRIIQVLEELLEESK